MGSVVPICVTVPNLVQIGQTVAETWRFNGFSKYRPSISWIFKKNQIFNGWYAWETKSA